MNQLPQIEHESQFRCAESRSRRTGDGRDHTGPGQRRLERGQHGAVADATGGASVEWPTSAPTPWAAEQRRMGLQRPTGDRPVPPEMPTASISSTP